MASGAVDLGAYLTYLTSRQEVVASNIANADTPGYKTLDVEMPGDFTSVWRFTPLATKQQDFRLATMATTSASIANRGSFPKTISVSTLLLSC